MEWENLKTYRDRLLWAMLKAKLTSQSELARRIGVKPQSIQHLLDPLKNAQGSSHTALIAEELKVSPKWLATGQGTPDVLLIDGNHRLFGMLKAEQSGEPLPAAQAVDMALSDVERELIRAFREIVLPEQRETATAPIFEKAEEARKVRQHYERLTGRNADNDKPDHELEHLRAPAHTPPAPHLTWDGQERRQHAVLVAVERRAVDAAPGVVTPIDRDETSGKGKQRGRMLGGRSQMGDLGAPEIKKGSKK